MDAEKIIHDLALHYASTTNPSNMDEFICNYIEARKKAKYRISEVIYWDKESEKLEPKD